MTKFTPSYWAVILGGSSGFGLATAKKLSRHRMNICIVHRDRRGAMKKIEPEFEAIRETGVKFIACNTNALSEDGRNDVLSQLKDAMGTDGRVRMLLHSIAFGNLKLMVQEPQALQEKHQDALAKLSDKLGVSAANLQENIDSLFQEGYEELAGVATPPAYSQSELLADEDFSLTLYSMGTSLASWVQDIYSEKIFADDARIFGLTSEGNEVAWKGYAAVAAAKTALEAVSRAIAKEYAPYGIRCNVIQAGVTDTPALRLIPGSNHLKAGAKKRNPFNRLTMPEDVANFIYLMCQDEAAWANGNIIRVDGGEHISG
ncbi:MAG: SDR family NAD(P)-dependent oxidoreductase [Calditrichaeota bacterium]|nr:MAG: SDR family NAD(P)-dependent oxidoreductase [Calditrichota bacterium]